MLMLKEQQQQKNKRQERKLTNEIQHSVENPPAMLKKHWNEVYGSSKEIDNEMFKNFEVSEPEAEIKQPGKIRIKMRHTALACDIFEISNKEETTVVSSVLKDSDITTNDDHSHIANKCKIRRGKKRRELQK